MYESRAPFTREQLVFMAEVIVAAAIDRVDACVPPCAPLAEWNDRDASTAEALRARCQAAKDTAGTALAVLYAELTGDGLDSHSAIQLAGLDVLDHFATVRLTDETCKAPNSHQLAELFISKTFDSATGKYCPPPRAKYARLQEIVDRYRHGLVLANYADIGYLLELIDPALVPEKRQRCPACGDDGYIAVAHPPAAPGAEPYRIRCPACGPEKEQAQPTSTAAPTTLPLKTESILDGLPDADILRSTLLDIASDCTREGAYTSQAVVVFQRIRRVFADYANRADFHQRVLQCWNDLFLTGQLVPGYDLDCYAAPHFHLRKSPCSSA